jgi:uncharacterized protein
LIHAATRYSPREEAKTRVIRVNTQPHFRVIYRVKRAARLFAAGLTGVAIGTPLAAILVTENALYIPHRPQPTAEAPAALARQTGATWRSAEARTADGVTLSAWLFTPRRANGSAVILLHGVADTRLGVLAHARFLLENGFTVLTPDVRGHGSSGGKLITYGVREAEDVRAWADWLFHHQPVQKLYGLGESMGASILLQSLAVEPRLRAVVAECPFVTFEQIARDRLSQVSGIPPVIFWPIVKFGFLYTRVRYGVDLQRASPARVVQCTRTPVLLIHGVLDDNIPVRHSRELRAANRSMVRLWEVPGAGHVGSLYAAADLYVKTVTEWFQSHP